MTQKRIALVGYSADYFRPFGKALEDTGFQVFWVHGTRSAARVQGADSKVLDTTAGFRIERYDHDASLRELGALESPGGPRICDLILMDRMLRLKPHAFAIAYLEHLRRELTSFFTANSIAIVSSGRDSALQLMSMLVCRKLGIPWYVPTRARIPQDLYSFATGHETADLVRIRAVRDEDREWAVGFLRSFEERRSQPALKAAARSFIDVARMLPRHGSLFLGLLRASMLDRGNDFSRYTLGKIIRMYVARRINLATFKLFPVHRAPASRPFCIYALHTQPESSIDVAGSYFSDQIALITTIARSMPVTHELYVKIHPTDVDGKPRGFYRRIADIPGVRLINYAVSSRQLIERAAIVFTLTGTIGYEAALLGRPVITFARNFFNDLPGVQVCEAPTRLTAMIDEALRRTTQEGARERTLEFLANLHAQSFPGEVNRQYLPAADALTSQDLATLQRAYDTLYGLRLEAS